MTEDQKDAVALISELIRKWNTENNMYIGFDIKSESIIFIDRDDYINKTIHEKEICSVKLTQLNKGDDINGNRN